MRTRVQLAALGVALAVVYGRGMAWARPAWAGDVTAWPAVATAGWALCLGAAVVVWRRRSRSSRGSGVLLVIGFAALFRLLAAADPAVLSSDLHRYLWDGRVQAAGISPYAFPPEAPELSHLRDDAVHPEINRPRAVTVYPPGAQVLFLGLHVAGVRSVARLRVAMGALDLVAIVLLALLLRARGDDPARVVLYAWAPMAVMEHAGNAHLESVVVGAVAAVLLLRRRGWLGWAGVALGVATLVKLYPVVLVAALRRRGDRRLPGALVATVAAGYAAYAPGAGPRVLGFLPDYVRSAEDFNVGLRRFLEPLLAAVTGAPRTVAFVLCLGLLALACGALATSRWSEDDPERRAVAALGALVLLVPTALHPWYATPLLALLCVHPYAAGVWLLTVLPLTYVKYAAPDGRMPDWVRPLEFLPAYALVAVAMVRGARRRHWGRGRRAAPC